MNLEIARAYLNRLKLPLAFLVVTLFVSTIVLQYLSDWRNSSAQKLSKEQARAKTLSVQIGDLEQNRAFLKDNLELFRTAIAEGFTSSQDRLAASEMITKVAKEVGILSAKYEFGAVKIISIKPVSVAGNVSVYFTQISITASSLSDSQIYQLVSRLSSMLPGYVTLSSLSLDRLNLDAAAIKKSLLTGVTPDVVSAKIDLNWFSLRLPSSASGGAVSGNAAVGGSN